MKGSRLQAVVQLVNTERYGIGKFVATISTGTERSVFSSRAARRLGIRGREGRVMLTLPGTGCRAHDQNVVVDDVKTSEYENDVVVGLDYLDFAEPWYTAKRISCCRDDPEYKRRFKGERRLVELVRR